MKPCATLKSKEDPGAKLPREQGKKMSSSTRTTAAQGKNCAQTLSARNLFCLVMIVMLAIVTAGARTLVTPNTTTIQYLGVPNPQNNTAAAVTAPLGGIILKGTAINPATGAFLSPFVGR